MTKVLKMLGSIGLIAILGVALLGVAITTSAQDPPPAPNPHVEKANNGPVAPGGVGTFTIALVNSGNASLGAAGLTDQLPGLDRGAHWDILGEHSFDSCVIASNVLTCFVDDLPGQHLVEQDDGQVFLENGEAVVTVWSVLPVCGFYENHAAVETDGDVLTASSTLSVTCPATPTPTATNTPTPTATPTSTATPTPTATAVPATATPTPRFGANNPAPGPPDTGTGTEESDSSAPILLFAALGLGAGAVAFGIGGAAIARRSR